MRLAAEEPPVGAEGEQQREPVRQDEDERHRLRHVELVGPRRGLGMHRMVERREGERHDRERQHARAQTGVGPIEAKLRAVQPASDERESHDQKQIAEDAAGDGCLHQVHQAGAERHERNDELRRIAEGRVEETAHRWPGAVCQMLRGLAHVSREREHAEAGGEEDPHRRGVQDVAEHHADGNRRQQHQAPAGRAALLEMGWEARVRLPAFVLGLGTVRGRPSRPLSGRRRAVDLPAHPGR